MASKTWRRLRRPQLALFALIALLIIGYAVTAVRDHASTSPHSVALSSLPPQATATVRLIQHGGPFPYPQDGVVFANAERHLRIEPRGYYHEYTVPTPGASDRGARRVVTGQDGSWYYTGDHYDSFVRVDVSR